MHICVALKFSLSQDRKSVQRYTCSSEHLDKLTAVCLINSILGLVSQATQRTLGDDELNELSRLVSLVSDGLPGSRKVNAKARDLCARINASRLFQSTPYELSELRTLIQEGERLRELLNPIYHTPPLP